MCNRLMVRLPKEHGDCIRKQECGIQCAEQSAMVLRVCKIIIGEYKSIGTVQNRIDKMTNVTH